MQSSMQRPPLPENLNTEAARWVVRRRAKCAPEEQRAFLRWLNADEANPKAYEQAEKLWQEMGGLDTVATRQLNEARAYLAQRRRRSSLRRMSGFALAASLVGVMVWSADWLSYLNDQTYRTAAGEHKSIVLADGSRMDLNTASEATVHYSRHGREVRLKRGQAAFTVAHENGRPFEVEAGEMRVRDIGTSFDVRESAERIEIAVLEGAVEVNARNVAARQLRQGQRLNYIVGESAATIEPVDVAAVSAWRDGRIVFKSQPLGQVLAELGRYHDASVVVTSPRILDTSISGAIPIDDLDVALTTLAATLPAKLIRTGPQSWRIDG